MLWRSPSPARHPAGFVEPCLPTLGQAVPSGPQWVHEIKHDGFRFRGQTGHIVLIPSFSAFDPNRTLATPFR